MFSKQFPVMLERCNEECWWVSPFYHVLQIRAQCRLVHAGAEHGHTSVNSVLFYYIKITLLCHGNVHPGLSDIRTGIATACVEQKRRII